MKQKIERLREQLNESREIIEKYELNQSKLEEVKTSSGLYQTQISDLTKANESVKFFLKNFSR